jgi:uncharacterized paraquat-inducible protein A
MVFVPRVGEVSVSTIIKVGSAGAIKHFDRKCARREEKEAKRKVKNVPIINRHYHCPRCKCQFSITYNDVWFHHGWRAYCPGCRHIVVIWGTLLPESKAWPILYQIPVSSRISSQDP